MSESNSKKTTAMSPPTTSAEPEKLSERQADPELLALHGIACAKDTLEALRNWSVRSQTSQD